MRAGRLLAIIISFAVLLGGGYAAWRLSKDRSTLKNNEAVLKQQLATMRAAIRSFHAAEGRYPRSLEELVPKYLRAIPTDPMTRATDWREVTEQTVQPSGDFTTNSTVTESYVIDVHSAAHPPYSNW